MRQKYNTFNISKINNITILKAQRLKKEIHKVKQFKEVFLQDPGSSHIPLDKDKFLGYLCLKYLQLKPEDGIPLLKQAYRQQYRIEDEFKLCEYCGKPFKFERKSRDFCSDRCRQRNQRHRKNKKKDQWCHDKGVSL